MPTDGVHKYKITMDREPNTEDQIRIDAYCSTHPLCPNYYRALFKVSFEDGKAKIDHIVTVKRSTLEEVRD